MLVEQVARQIHEIGLSDAFGSTQKARPAICAWAGPLIAQVGIDPL